ncbi:MAG TPA: TonB-dependent receptor [Acidobacteriaceae bacterium]|nr:TonB-dependent receptor [Acidobacteriaceae bacterium]
MHGLYSSTLRSRLVGLLIFVLWVAAHAASGQTGSTLQGQVSDATGGAIPQARVQIQAIQTGVIREEVSNSAGLFTAPDLPTGRYKVTVSATGFRTVSLNDVVLSVGGTRDLDIKLTVGEIDTVVNVTTESNAISTTDTSQQGLIDGRQTRDLPTNGRDFTNLATLNSGVSQIATQYPGAATATTKLSRGLGLQLTIGGNRPQQNSYRLDGVNINDYANGGPGSVSGYTLGVDAVQEFSVVTSDAPAQYGRMSGGAINEVTRQGANQFHASVYDFLRNSVFDARSYFDPLSGEPSFRRNQFGATAGGPIWKDKTFFFANYEGFRQAQGVTMQSTVLSPNAERGLVTCTQPATGTQNAACKTNAGGTTQASPGTAGYQQLTVDPKVVPYLALYPAPNGTISGNTGLYGFQTTQKTNENFSTVHLDQVLTASDSLHGTLLYDSATLDSADQTNTLYDEAISRRTTAALEEVHVFGPHMTSAERIGYNRSVAIAPNLKQVLNPAVDNAALSFYPSTGRSVGQLLVSSLTTVQGGSGSVGTNAFHYNSYQAYDDATYLLGRHTISFGFAFESDQNNASGGVLPNGEWSFGSINNFLQNVPQFFEGGVPGTPALSHSLRQEIVGAYVQDSWKALNNLTLNLGMRYEMATDTVDHSNRMGALPTPTSPAAVLVSSFFTNNPTLKNFEPRVGIAWDVFHNGKTVVTAASGIYDNLPLNYTFQLQLISSAPSYDEGRVTYTGSAGKGLYPVSPFFTGTPKLRVIYTPPTPPRSYVIQTNAAVQQQLMRNLVLTAGWIGSHGVHQVFSTNDINNVAPQGRTPDGTYYWPGTARGLPTLNPALGTESYTAFIGSSLYDSLQTSLAYNSPRGISGKIAYTWSHSIDDSSSSISGASFSNAVSGLLPFDMRLNRANSDFDVRNVFSANMILPIYNVKRGDAATSVLRGWSWNNIFSARTGVPFTPIVSGDPLGWGGSQTFNFPNRVVYSRSCTRPHNLNYIDTSCFTFPGTYAYTYNGVTYQGPLFGTSRRNTLQGPGLFFWTSGVMKEQAVTERLRLQFQAQVFNVTNHTNFANPAAAQTQIFNAAGTLSGTAGVLTGPTATSGRQWQFALKALF